MSDLVDTLRTMATAVRDATHGEVFTRRWVVDLMLDLCNYRVEEPLAERPLLEPAAGSGAFFLPALERLIDSAGQYGKTLTDLSGSLTAVDIQRHNVEALRQSAAQYLSARGFGDRQVRDFVNSSIIHADSLLQDFGSLRFDVVVGNPPYIRIEDLGRDRQAMYRAASPAMAGRADIFVAFYDRGLDLLSAEGRLAYICADRWMRNDYGRLLRRKVLAGFAVDVVLTMHDAAAFEEQVSAYPAITVLRRGPQVEAVLANADEKFDTTGASELMKWMTSAQPTLEAVGVTACRLPHWHNTDASWPDASPERIAWLERLEEALPEIEETGVRIGIGVATGNDKFFCRKSTDIPDVEAERLLPLVVADDIRTGRFENTGVVLLNPWDVDGLVDLNAWPKFREVVQSAEHELRARHTAKSSPAKWYKTIDRVNFSLISKPKLLFQDLKAQITPVLHTGGAYPHHNLYYLVSDTWDLEVLGGLMLSDVVEAQVSAYCVKMRGGTLRFQAQYLRRVRLPLPHRIAPAIQERLREAFRLRDRDAATTAALEAFDMACLPT